MRARRNMAIEAYGIKFDTVGELLAYQKAIGAAPQVGSPPSQGAAGYDQFSYQKAIGAAPQVEYDPFKQGSRGTSKKKPTFTIKAEHHAMPVSYMQGKTINIAVGGMKAFCPNRGSEKMSAADALTALGLNFASAHEVISKLDESGLLWPKKHETGKHQKAAEVLSSVGGIACDMKKNPRRIIRYFPQL